MNPFEMVVCIVFLVMAGSVIRAFIGRRGGNGSSDDAPRNDRTVEENQRLRGEIGNLKERIAVLERVITDNNSSSSNLDREIEKLRNRDA
jgi:predicted RNase H-like nuclease (RuvC/YqgF family)